MEVIHYYPSPPKAWHQKLMMMMMMMMMAMMIMMITMKVVMVVHGEGEYPVQTKVVN